MRWYAIRVPASAAPNVHLPWPYSSTCPDPKNARSPSRACDFLIGMRCLLCSIPYVVLGSFTPRERYAANTSPEQSNPLGPVPPQMYGLPRWCIAQCQTCSLSLLAALAALADAVAPTAARAAVD